MLVYNPAFDMYHTVFRILNILSYHSRGEYVETERLRIWDFYLLFPEEVENITLRRDEKEVRSLIKNQISTKSNPYRNISDSRKLFEKIRPYQMNALKCMSSYGLINDDYVSLNKVKLLQHVKLKKSNPLLIQNNQLQMNVIKLMTSHFFLMPLYGEKGLKKRTGLLEHKYDA